MANAQEKLCVMQIIDDPTFQVQFQSHMGGLSQLCTPASRIRMQSFLHDLATGWLTAFRSRHEYEVAFCCRKCYAIQLACWKRNICYYERGLRECFLLDEESLYTAWGGAWEDEIHYESHWCTHEHWEENRRLKRQTEDEEIENNA